MKLQNLNSNSVLDSTAMSDLAGGMRFVWKRIRKVRCVFGIRIVYYIWKLVPVCCCCRGRRRGKRC